MLVLLSAIAMAAEPWTAMVDVLPQDRPPEALLLPIHLIPIGFSPSGAFAWIELPPDEAVGCFLWDFRITNLVTDEQLYRHHSGEPSPSDCQEITDGSRLVAQEGEAIRATLQKYGVKADRALPLLATPYASGGDLFDLQLVPGPPRWDQGAISMPLDLRFRSRLLGTKSIGTLEVLAHEDMPQTWGQEVLGLIASPFEQRVVVVVREIGRGWEGPPNPEHLRILGASLDKGFDAPGAKGSAPGVSP